MGFRVAVVHHCIRLCKRSHNKKHSSPNGGVTYANQEAPITTAKSARTGRQEVNGKVRANSTLRARDLSPREGCVQRPSPGQGGGGGGGGYGGGGGVGG